MIRLQDKSEQVRYITRKTKSPVLFMVIFFSIWLSFGYLIEVPLFRELLAGRDVAVESYILGMAWIVIFVPVALMILMSFALNQIVITDKRLYVRRGVPGQLLTIDLTSVRSFQQLVTGTHNRTTNHILFYLDNGRLVKTGSLHTTLASLTELLDLLRERYEGRGFTLRERREMKHSSQSSCQPVTRFIPTPLILLVVLLVVPALLLTVLYF